MEIIIAIFIFFIAISLIGGFMEGIITLISKFLPDELKKNIKVFFDVLIFLSFTAGGAILGSYSSILWMIGGGIIGAIIAIGLISNNNNQLHN